MPGVKTFDPKQVSVVVGGNIISGWGPDEAISAERNKDAWTLKVGVDGEAARSKSNDKSGRIKLTLLQTSQSNNALSALAAADELSNAGAVPFFLKDNSPTGSTTGAALTCWVLKYPAVKYAHDVELREWTLETDDIELLVGGN
jgi:hypothetical protein